jgi:indole-3-glycerol phosphate synthase
LIGMKKNALFICESGLKDAVTIKEMRALGYDGFLIGSSFMKTDDPGAALGEMMRALS